MGRVKIDLHKKDRQYQITNLSDIQAIQGLIKFRPELDPYFYIHNYRTEDIRSIDEEIIILYIDLDNLIEKCQFTFEQHLIIRLIQKGYSFNEIDKKMDIKSRNEIIKICKAIQYQNLKQWAIWINKNYVDKGTKKCGKCGEELPISDIFFTNKKDATDGKHPYCNKCR